MLTKIIKTVFRFLDLKHICLYIFIQILKMFSKFFELIGIFTILPIVLLLLNNQQPSYLESFSKNFNVDFLLDKEISFYLISLLVIFICKNFVILSFTLIKLKIEKFIVSKLYIDLLKVFTFYSFQKFKSFTQGQLIRNIITESRNFERLSFNIFDLIFNSLFLIFLVILILNIGDLEILISYFTILVIIIFLFYKILKQQMLLISNKVAILNVKVAESVIDSVNLYLEKILNNLREKFLVRYLNFFEKLVIKQNLRTFLNSLPKSIIELSLIAFFVVFLFYSLSFEKDNQLLFEEFFIILASISRMLPTVAEMQQNINSIYFSKRSLENIQNELDILKQKRKRTNKKEIQNKSKINSIQLQNINFDYNKKTILKKLSFKAYKGQTIGVMGKSGVGKSTLGLLIAGILVQKSGHIKINDKKMKKKDKIYKSFGNIGYVSQNIHLLNDTLKNNITFSFGDKIDVINYKKSIKISEVESFLSKNRKKDNIYLKNNGSNLSVGQRQRVAIARAIYHSDEILILDEATSNLDSSTEDLIFRNLKKIKKNLIIFVITHKKKNIKFFDKLIYLK